MSDQIKALHEDRLNAATEMNKLVSDMGSGVQERNAENKEKLDRYNAVIDERAAEIAAIQKAAAVEKEVAEARAEFERVVRPAEPKIVRVSEVDDEMLAYFRGERGKSYDADITSIAREARQLRRNGMDYRDLVKVTAAAGGTLVPTTMLAQLYVYLQDFAGIRQTNVRVLTTASGENLDMPTVATYGTAAIVGEGSALAEADETFSKVTLLSWKYGRLTQVSTELEADSGINILEEVAADAGRSLGIATGNAYLNGTGSNQPQGALTAYATGVTGANGGTGVPTYQNLVSMVYSVDAPYRRRGAYWMWADSTVGKIRGIVDGQGRPIWEPNSQVGQPDRLLGFPVIADPAVAAAGTGVVCGIFGDFSGFVIRDVGSVRFERSDDFAFGNDLISFRSILRTDSKVLDTRSLRVYRGGTA